MKRAVLLLCGKVMVRKANRQGLNFGYYNSGISAPSAGHSPLPKRANRKLINSMVIKIALFVRAIEWNIKVE